MSTLASKRRRIERRMLDEAVIRRKTGNMTKDPTTGSEVPEYGDVFFTKCRIKSTRTYGVQNQEVGGRTAQVVSREFHLPVDSPEVRTDDIAVMVTIHETTDPTLLNATVTFSAPSPGSQTTARRLEITEIAS